MLRKLGYCHADTESSGLVCHPRKHAPRTSCTSRSSSLACDTANALSGLAANPAARAAAPHRSTPRHHLPPELPSDASISLPRTSCSTASLSLLAGGAVASSASNTAA
nr:unnamed protein product [Digitaria exilis]